MLCYLTKLTAIGILNETRLVKVIRSGTVGAGDACFNGQSRLHSANIQKASLALSEETNQENCNETGVGDS